MLQRAHLLTPTLLILALGIFLAIAWRSGKIATALQDGPLGFACEMHCSQTEPGTPTAELSWRANASDLSQQALEVTVYKDGFQRGIFARLSPIRRDQKFVVIAPSEQQRQGVPGLDRLALTDVELIAGGRVRVRVKDLEPGLYYFWRIRSADGATSLSGTIDCEAPACPTDELPEQQAPPR